MRHESIPLFETGRFSELMQAYVNGDKSLKPFYGRPHSPGSYKEQIEEKSQHAIDRKLLADVLHSQYAELDIEKRYPRVGEALDILKNQEAYTVTTGHQLCLFTGPLYFIYKIINTIRLAEELSEREKVPVLPVFWMASEDHDFDEVNHVWYGDLKYSWNHPSGDAVGRMDTEGIAVVVDTLAQQLSDSRPVQDLIDLFRRCYRSGQTLAAATRELVTELFGRYGLLVLDGDDPRLKAQMIDIFADELASGQSGEAVHKQSEQLEQLFHQQVTPRDINLFYLNEGRRYRLTRLGDEVITVDGPHKWTQDAVLEELRSHPGRFSPNVIMRPLYQEVVLPNLAYIGGGGELAYWLQLKPMFDLYGVPFPILRLRNSAGFISRRIAHKMSKLGMTPADIFAPPHELRRKYFRKELQLDGEMEALRKQTETLFAKMEALADRIDPSLTGTAKAYLARQEHMLGNFELKILRSAQRRESEVTRMFDEILNEVFPAGALQERRDTYITLVERFGDGVIELLYDELDPFAHDFSWFIE